jgi:GH24 family phage-related lysozyme (muramidase)
MSRKINIAGLQLIKEFEGFRSKPYLDAVGVPTIGYGNTSYEDGTKVKMSDKAIDETRASQLLQNKVDDEFGPGVEKLVKVQINDNQFSALVSFAYNLGLHNLSQSTLLRCLNAKNYKDAADEFLRWNKAGGIVLPGLTRRREAERLLFLA